jgi:ankyrin repeat protein
LLIEYAVQNDKHISVENLLFVAAKTGQSKCWLDIACENNQSLAIILLQNNIQPDFESIQFGIKGKNASILRAIFERVGLNFDQFARKQSKIVDNFPSDVTIADEACLSGDVDVVGTVTEYFPELVNSRKETSFLVLMKAAITGGICEIVNKMVNLGVNGSSPNQDFQIQKNRVVFSIACKHGATEVAKYFGSVDNTLFTSRDKNDHTPLHSAAIGGTKEIAEYLIKGGADPFAVTVKQATALHLSCASGNLDIVTLLVDNYPTLIEMEDKKEATPVHYATRGGSIEILTLLIEKRADIAKVTKRGESILHVSCHRGYIEIAKFITKKCPELSSATTKDGMTALHFACTTDDLDLVKFLVEDLHLDPLQKTNAGETSLQMANCYEVINYLQSICPPRKPSSNSRIGPNVFESVTCDGITL